MSSILEEIDSYFGCGSMSDEEYLEHYGMPRRSGRYTLAIMLLQSLLDILLPISEPYMQ